MTAAKRIAVDRCCGLIIDVQEFFLSQIDTRLRSKLETNIKNFAPPARLFPSSDGRNPGAAGRSKGRLAQGDRQAPKGGCENFRKGFLRFDQGEEDCRLHCAPEKQASHRGGLRNRCLRPAILPRPSRAWLRRLRGGGARVFLVAKRRRGDRQNEGRRRRVPDLQEPLLRAGRGGGRRTP